MDANIIYTFQHRDLYLLGQFTALSIVEGCCGLPLFSEALYEYLCKGQYVGRHSPISDEELPLNVMTVVAKVCFFLLRIHFKLLQSLLKITLTNLYHYHLFV